MADISKHLIGQLKAALADLGTAQTDVTDHVRECLGPQASMALDDLLAASYQIVEAAGQTHDLPTAA